MADENDVSTEPSPSGERSTSNAESVQVSYQPTCVWPEHPVRRIAVLTNGPAQPALIAAIEKMIGPDQWVRWIERHHGLDTAARSAVDDFSPWWDWADVVVTDATDRSIAECVERGAVPAVALPSQRRSAESRRALDVVHAWSARGLALQLRLDEPSPGLLESAAGVRARRRRAFPAALPDSAR